MQEYSKQYMKSSNEKAAQTMFKNKIRRLPIVNEYTLHGSLWIIPVVHNGLHGYYNVRFRSLCVTVFLFESNLISFYS
jgi:hypothetical protein